MIYKYLLFCNFINTTTWADRSLHLVQLKRFKLMKISKRTSLLIKILIPYQNSIGGSILHLTFKIWFETLIENLNRISVTFFDELFTMIWLRLKLFCRKILAYMSLKISKRLTWMKPVHKKVRSETVCPDARVVCSIFYHAQKWKFTKASSELCKALC